MAKTAKLKATLSLDNVRFVRSIKDSIRFAKDLAKQFRAQPIKTTFLAGVLSARRGIQATASALEGMGRIAIQTFKVASVAATAFAVGILGISIKAVEAAAQMETMETGFKVFLGSAEAAKDRMKELTDFASHTPFMLPQIAAASKTLQVLTHGMLATSKGLEIVGDVASGTNREIADTATTVGKLFSALRSGTHAGQALESLQETGAISPQARRQIEGMAQIDGAKAWKIAEKELSRFTGMMVQQSQTWEGMMSTFHDSIFAALAAFGAPLIKELKPTLDEITQVVFALGPKISEAGKAFAAGIKTGIGVLEEAFFDPSGLVGPFKLGLKAGVLEASNLLIAGVKTAASLIPDMAKTLASTFTGIADIISGELLKAFAEPVAWFAAHVEEVMDRLNENLHPDPKKIEAEAYARGHQRDADAAANRGDWKEVARQSMLIKKYADMAAGPTMEERVKSYTNKNDITQRGAEKVKQGQDKLSDTTKSALDAIGKAASNFQVEDVTHAGNAMKEFWNAIWKFAEKGQQHTENAINEATKAQVKTRAAIVAHGLPISSLGSSGGLAGASMTTGTSNPFTSGFFGGGPRPGSAGFIGPMPARPPIGQGSMLAGGATRTVNSLLPLKERRAAAAAVRAASAGEYYLKHGRFEQGGQLGKVSSGDRKAAMEYVRDKQREKQGLDKTNQLLENLEKKFDTAWGT